MEHKIKPVIFFIFSLFVCLLSACSTLYQDYIFSGKDRKILMKIIEPPGMMRYLDLLHMDKSYTNFRIEFDTLYNEKENIYDGRYRFRIVIFPSEYDLIENIYINNITIYASNNVYNLTDKIERITSFHESPPHNPTTRLKGDDLLNINSGGIINIADTYHDPDDRYTFTGKLWHMQIEFQEVLIDFRKNKELKVALDLGVEYTSGETIIVNNEFVASLKKRWVENDNHINRWLIRFLPTA
jgi:hypothetical protein